MTASSSQPEELPLRKNRILDAAEQHFAMHGYAGAGVARIAQEALVSQALLHYHFNTKERLYSAVIERRAGTINAQRIELLEAIDITGLQDLPRIFEAFFGPPLGPDGGGVAYARITARLAAREEPDLALVKQLYDPIAKRFMAALQKACPDASLDVLAWGYSLAVSVLMSAATDEHRVARLSGGKVIPRESDAFLSTIVNYVCGGLTALINEEENTRK